ncbi:MAG TPA: hypothetical protein VFM18_04910 [Methanosarcina sp.]|nr:hypothetical protein [Methanosarcina sp.]
MKIFILVLEYNSYDQQGLYYIKAYKTFPTKSQLLKEGLTDYEATNISNRKLGRLGNEDMWYDIIEDELL